MPLSPANVPRSRVNSSYRMSWFTHAINFRETSQRRTALAGSRRVWSHSAAEIDWATMDLRRFVAALEVLRRLGCPPAWRCRQKD